MNTVLSLTESDCMLPFFLKRSIYDIPVECEEKEELGVYSISSGFSRIESESENSSSTSSKRGVFS